MKYPVKLFTTGVAPCGCRFGYKLGFKIVCETHVAIFAGISAHRQAMNATPQILWPKVKPKKKSKGITDSAKVTAAFRDEIARRTEILRNERAKIKRPSNKLTKKQREHLHTFAFTAEQVRREVLA